jgi:hypothetical protein
MPFLGELVSKDHVIVEKEEGIRFVMHSDHGTPEREGQTIDIALEPVFSA